MAKPPKYKAEILESLKNDPDLSENKRSKSLAEALGISIATARRHIKAVIEAENPVVNKRKPRKAKKAAAGSTKSAADNENDDENTVYTADNLPDGNESRRLLMALFLNEATNGAYAKDRIAAAKAYQKLCVAVGLNMDVDNTGSEKTPAEIAAEMDAVLLGVSEEEIKKYQAKS